MFAKHGAAAVCFEVGRLSAKGGHAHVQVVPVPNKLAGAVEDVFRQVSPLLTDETMRELNGRVDEDGEEPGDVAFDWMVSQGLITRR